MRPRKQGTPDRARCVLPQPPQFVLSPVYLPLLWGNPGCGDEGPGTMLCWIWLFLCEVARGLSQSVCIPGCIFRA